MEETYQQVCGLTKKNDLMEWENQNTYCSTYLQFSEHV